MGHHTGGSGSGKTKLLNLIKQKNEDDYNISVKICLYYLIILYFIDNINILLENMKKIDLEEHEDRKALNE